MAPTDPKEPPMTTTTEAPASTVDPATIEPVKAGELAVATPAPLDAAAAQVADLPGVLGRDEFVALAMQARILSMSGAAPEAVRNNPYVAFHVAMVGRDLGISASAALELIDIIKSGGNYRLSLSPQLLNGQIRRLGLGSIVPLVQEVDRCIAVALMPHGHADVRCGTTWPDHHADCRCSGILGSTEFTWEEARMAGLVAEGCEPGNHTVKCLNSKSEAWARCNQGYRTYPKRMMWWRAGGYCADDWFPEAGLGLYSPEELGAVVDVDGRPIDPTTVELPDGYQPKAPEPVPMATARTIAELRHIIDALPEPGRGALRGMWKGDDANNPYLQPLDKLPERQVKKAWAVVDHIAQRAAAGEWGAWERPEPLPADEDSGQAPPEQAGEGEGREVPAPPADPSSSPATTATTEEPDPGAEAIRRELDALADSFTTPPPVAPVDTTVDDELEAIAQAYEGLTPHQQEWMAAAIAKEGIRHDQLTTNATARATFKALIDGAALQPAEAPQDATEPPPAPDTQLTPAEATTEDLVARTAAIAAKAQAKKGKPAPPEQGDLLGS